MDNTLMPRKAIIKEIVEETYDTKTFTFKYVDGEPKGMEFEPGQFAMIYIPGVGEAAISISHDPDDLKSLDLTIRKVGSVTGVLFSKAVGDTIGLRGPYGNGWPYEEAKGKNVLVITGGCGNGALRPIVYAQMNDPSRFRYLEVLHGARSPDDHIFRSSYEEEWAKIPNCGILLSSDAVPSGQSWDHKVGFVNSLLLDMRSKPEDTYVMMCGPEVMMKFTCLDLLKIGFTQEQIYVSMERRMRCGVGFCGHCQIGSKYVCKDGPIFSYAELQELPDHIVR
jgi:NAD(P)H-flavin reductase